MILVVCLQSSSKCCICCLLTYTPSICRTSYLQSRCQCTWLCFHDPASCILRFLSKTNMINLSKRLTFSFKMASLSIPVVGDTKFSFLTAKIDQVLMFIAIHTSPDVPDPSLCPSFHLISFPHILLFFVSKFALCPLRMSLN